MSLISQNALDLCGISTEQHLLIAVSGGQDSMTLAFALVAQGFKTSWAHCNFGLRAEESNRDEEFVRTEAQKLGIELYTRAFSKEDFSNTGLTNTQAAARQLRYAWFEELRTKINADAICVAHHAHDQLETFFMNLVRGTGIDGLTGIAWRNGMIARPMLDLDPEQIKQYAGANNVAHVEDSSNLSTKYRRNKFRHEVLPVLKTINPNLVNTVLREQNIFKEQENISREYVKLTLPTLSHTREDMICIEIEALQQTAAPRLLLWSAIKECGFSSKQTDEVYKLIDSQAGKTVTSANFSITRERNQLLISPLVRTKEPELIFHSIEELAKHDKFETTFGSGSPAIDPNSLIGLFDLNKIEFPLTLRTWASGDKFIPLGMKSNQKISDFLTQAKVNSSARDQVMVLISNKEIIWVVGQRISDNVKITSETTDYLSVRTNHPK